MARWALCCFAVGRRWYIFLCTYWGRRGVTTCIPHLAPPPRPLHHTPSTPPPHPLHTLHTQDRHGRDRGWPALPAALPAPTAHPLHLSTHPPHPSTHPLHTPATPFTPRTWTSPARALPRTACAPCCTPCPACARSRSTRAGVWTGPCARRPPRGGWRGCGGTWPSTGTRRDPEEDMCTSQWTSHTRAPLACYTS